jgi:hypothetical protein
MRLKSYCDLVFSLHSCKVFIYISNVKIIICAGVSFINLYKLLLACKGRGGGRGRREKEGIGLR